MRAVIRAGVVVQCCEVCALAGGAEVATRNGTLGEARLLLEQPGANHAAVALLTIMEAAKSCDPEAVEAVKVAERAARDVVVLRCRSPAEPGNRRAFLEAAEEAFGRPVDGDLRAKLLLAYHKIARITS